MYLFNSIFDFNGETLDALIIFSGQLEGDSEEYGFLFERLMHSDDPRPSVVFFIFPDFLSDEILSLSEPDSAFYDNIVRFGESIPVIICGFDGYGDLVLKKSIFCEESKVKLSGFKLRLINDGILALAMKRKNAVIMKAPPGTFFVKPSDKQLDEFIQASGLAVGYAENQFVAFSLLCFRPKDIEINSIYIDTSGISGFIEALTYYLYRFSNNKCKPVKYYSFNSYFGLDEVKPDDTSDIWVVISASSSNSMGKKIIKEWSIKEEQVLTILSFTDKLDNGKGDTVICNISSISDGYKNPNNFMPKVGVKVLGENFTAEICESKKVIIKSSHKTQEVTNLVERFNCSGVFVCSKSSLGTGTIRPVFVDLKKMLQSDKELKKWIRETITWYIPLSLKWVVYDHKDAASRELFDFISENLPKNISPLVIDFEDAKTKISGDGTALILSSVISSGKSLLKLNANLRISGHKGNRIFITPLVTAHSELGFINLKNSLLYGPNGFKYLFFNFYQIFIGHSNLKHSWQSELRVVENFKSDFWLDRSSVLSREGEGVDGAIGTPSMESSEKLEFTQDFAFWASSYDCTKINPEAVYLTIASVLQGLREKSNIKNDEDSLYSHVYQHSVISPDNFTRFNDGLIQSCLWRTANASELDYRSSDNLSESFSVILSRLVDDASEGKSNAFLDMIMGIAIGKITLTQSVLKDLVSYIKVKLADKEYVIELLCYIEQKFFK